MNRSTGAKIMANTDKKWYYEFSKFSSISPNGQFTVKAGEVGVPICILPMPIGGINPKEKQEANAKLIAAAPELLEACERALLILKIIRERGNEFEEIEKRSSFDANITISLLNNAIKKATD